MNPIVETERLALRELQPSDLDFVAGMLGHPDVSFHYARTFTWNDSRVWLDRQLERYQRDGHGLWLVTRRETGEPVGQVGLAIQEVDGERRPEVGWLLARPHWGRGYATEAGKAVRDLAFDRWRYPEVISLIRPVNAASRRVAERVGLTAGPQVEFHGFTHIVYRQTPPDRPGHPVS